MKAITREEYGGPEVLRLSTVAQPEPKATEVRIKVKAAGFNPMDRHIMRGLLPIRPQLGLFKPKRQGLGVDVAGVIDKVGEQVTDYQVGDAVFGATEAINGFAEYCVLEPGRMAIKPEGLSFEAVAALPIAANTALESLQVLGKVQPGATLLINGASGGVGTYMVQLARNMGMQVTGVCSTANLEMVKSLGAHEVIDYTKEDWTKSGKTYDYILSNIGNHSMSTYKKLLNPGGTCLVIGMIPISLKRLFGAMFAGMFLSKFSDKTLKVLTTNVNAKNLAELARMQEEGALVSQIEQRYTLDSIPQAMQHLESNRVKGKLVALIDE